MMYSEWLKLTNSTENDKSFQHYKLAENIYMACNEIPDKFALCKYYNQSGKNIDSLFRLENLFNNGNENVIGEIFSNLHENDLYRRKKAFIEKLSYTLKATGYIQECNYYISENGEEYVSVVSCAGETFITCVSADSYIAMFKDVARSVCKHF